MQIAHVSPRAVSEASAAHRLRSAQRSIGIDAYSLVHSGNSTSDVRYLSSNSTDKYLKAYGILNKLPLKFHPKRIRSLPWTCSYVGYTPKKIFNFNFTDVVNLHWISGGCISFSFLASLDIPIVWTLHDVWPITAGCHCNLGCELWRQGCPQCPQLGSSVHGFDTSANIWKLKLKDYSKIGNLTIVTPSKWLFELAKASELMSKRTIVHIPNCLNTSLFKPLDKNELRNKYKIPRDKRIIVFGAADSIKTTYKGFDLFKTALEFLPKYCASDIHLVIFGTESINTTLQYTFTCLGNICDELKMAEIYNLGDVFVAPSRQDNLPNTFLEATSCGLPTVAFDVGGISDITIHEKNGYLAQPFDCQELAYGISWVLKNTETSDVLNLSAREHAISTFSQISIASSYKSLYSSLINKEKENE
jgi:glycosyltransferase involved in cell wall biosynthesis